MGLNARVARRPRGNPGRSEPPILCLGCAENQSEFGEYSFLRPVSFILLIGGELYVLCWWCCTDR